MGKVFIPFLVYQIPLRLKIPLQSLRPVKKIQELSSPVLIVAGSNDKYTLLSESKALFELAPEPKELYIVDNAEHVDFHSFNKEQYEKKILKFFEEHL
ncbi:MAG: alpha/beta hydrolase [Alphaproteobacteria bacterium]